jgi:type IV pilus assembly protein PilQ
MFKAFKLITTLFFVFHPLIIIGQNEYSGLNAESQLEVLSKTKKGLNEEVRIDLSGLTLYDFLTTIAEEHKLNVSVDPELNQLVTSNFFDVNVKDVFLFLIDKHNIEFEINNGILVFEKKEQEIIKPQTKPKKKIDVSYNDQNDFLSLRLKNDSLSSVSRAITDVSGVNVVLSPEVREQTVSAYILNRPFDQVLELMAKSNELVALKDENGDYFLEKDNSPQKEITSSQRNSKSRNFSNRSNDQVSGKFSVDIDEQGFLDVSAFNANGVDIITEAADILNINFFMYDSPTDIKTTLVAKKITFDILLDHIFSGEEFTYKTANDIYLIGQHTTNGLRSAELIQLENRTIESVLSSLPKHFSQELEIKEFVELNGFVVSGSKIQIQELRDYIRAIDIVVPNIQIEVIIVQYQKSYDIQTGLQAGLNKNNEVTTQGVLFPAQNMTLNGSSVNSLIDAFNGLGIINLGKVTQDFYLNLSALENNSIIKVSSTPKLVTLNGHDAVLSIGETNYYFEQSNQLISTGVNDNVLQSGQWKSTEANLSVNIKPTVSKDEHVTLVIEVERSSFLARVGETAPPGKATQKFRSMVRVKNNEMILIGGLEENENENSGTGTPFLSRIPIIKWYHL